MGLKKEKKKRKVRAVHTSSHDEMGRPRHTGGRKGKGDQGSDTFDLITGNFDKVRNTSQKGNWKLHFSILKSSKLINHQGLLKT